MTDWFRSWHGAPTDPKWVLIARKAGTTPAVASAIAWALFDHASQATPRGNVTGFDCEVYAAWGGLEDEVVRLALSAMADRGMIVDGLLSSWAKRQPSREDGSAERAREWRERKKDDPQQVERTRTQPNATDQQIQSREDTEKKDSSLPSVENSASAPKQSLELELISMGCSETLISDWKKLRKARKSPLSSTVIAGLKREAIKAGIPPPEALRITVERGWQNFNADWNWQNGQSTRNHERPERVSPHDRTLAVLAGFLDQPDERRFQADDPGSVCIDH